MEDDTKFQEVENTYQAGYYEEGDPDDPWSGGYYAPFGNIKTRVTGHLAGRVLERVGVSDAAAVVEIVEAHWDSGFCSTCSSPEQDFHVLVNGEEAYKTPSYEARGEALTWLTTYNHFNNWLNGADRDADPYEEDEDE